MNSLFPPPAFEDATDESGERMVSNARQMLLATRTDLLNLACSIDRGERQGRDKDVFAVMLQLDRNLGVAINLLIDYSQPGRVLALQ